MVYIKLVGKSGKQPRSNEAFLLISLSIEVISMLVTSGPSFAKVRYKVWRVREFDKLSIRKLRKVRVRIYNIFGINSSVSSITRGSK